jgi:hypothetical protein
MPNKATPANSLVVKGCWATAPKEGGNKQPHQLPQPTAKLKSSALKEQLK